MRTPGNNDLLCPASPKSQPPDNRPDQQARNRHGGAQLVAEARPADGGAATRRPCANERPPVRTATAQPDFHRGKWSSGAKAIRGGSAPVPPSGSRVARTIADLANAEAPWIQPIGEGLTTARLTSGKASDQ